MKTKEPNLLSVADFQNSLDFHKNLASLLNDKLRLEHRENVKLKEQLTIALAGLKYECYCGEYGFTCEACEVINEIKEMDK